jgi:hypothetical protein
MLPLLNVPGGHSEKVNQQVVVQTLREQAEPETSLFFELNFRVLEIFFNI